VQSQAEERTPTVKVKVLACLLAIGVLSLMLAGSAQASRELLTKTAVYTTYCVNCPLRSEGETLSPTPPIEGQIEGSCGLAISPNNSLYVSDYYHRDVDVYGSTGEYQSQISLAGTNPIFGVNTLDAVCGLAFDSSGNLYANEFHQGVLSLPGEQILDSNHSTGVAGDSAGNLYVDDRTYIAVYEPPFKANEPSKKIGLDSAHDFYGLAVAEGKIYVADAADQTIKVFEPAVSESVPVATIDGPPSEGFSSLVNAALAVDPGNGHLLVVDNLQPKFEHPKSGVYEFDSTGAFLGRIPGAPVHGEPSGIAVDPASGTLFVTDGNSELSNVFAYGPYTSPGAPIASPPPADSTGSAAAAEVGAGATRSSPSRPRGSDASASVVVRRGPVQVSFDGKLTPHSLPRHGRAPVGIAVDADISGTGSGSPPQLRRLEIAINRNGHFSPQGLPLCKEREIQPSSTATARAACGDALVGEGHFAANVRLPEQSPFPSSGKVLAFNGRVHGRPAILAHIYGTQPAPTSYVLPFLIGSSRGTGGTYGTVLKTSLPQATGDWGYVTGLKMTLRRNFRYHGVQHSYLSAGCPAPRGFPGAVFPLARTSFDFAGGMTVVSVLNRSCKAYG
jgi:hypothetical protein